MDEKILHRVRALLAKAESTTFPAEAEAYTAKAMRLMADYGIDQAMLAATGRRSDAIGSTSIALSNPYSFEKCQLLAAVAIALRCRVLAHRTGRTIHYCDVSGYSSDRERVEILFTSLLLQATSQSVRLPADVKHRRSWWHGFAYTVQLRLEEIETRAVQEHEQASGSGAELVLADRRTQVDHWHTQRHGKVGKFVSSAEIDPRGWAHGAAAGRKADLGGTGLTKPRRTALR